MSILNNFTYSDIFKLGNILTDGKYLNEFKECSKKIDFFYNVEYFFEIEEKIKPRKEKESLREQFDDIIKKCFFYSSVLSEFTKQNGKINVYNIVEVSFDDNLYLSNCTYLIDLKNFIIEFGELCAHLNKKSRFTINRFNKKYNKYLIGNKC